MKELSVLCHIELIDNFDVNSDTVINRKLKNFQEKSEHRRVTDYQLLLRGEEVFLVIKYFNTEKYGR